MCLLKIIIEYNVHVKTKGKINEKDFPSVSDQQRWDVVLYQSVKNGIRLDQT